MGMYIFIFLLENEKWEIRTFLYAKYHHICIAIHFREINLILYTRNGNDKTLTPVTLCKCTPREIDVKWKALYKMHKSYNLYFMHTLSEKGEGYFIIESGRINHALFSLIYKGILQRIVWLIRVFCWKTILCYAFMPGFHVGSANLGRGAWYIPMDTGTLSHDYYVYSRYSDEKNRKF